LLQITLILSTLTSFLTSSVATPSHSIYVYGVGIIVGKKRNEKADGKIRSDRKGQGNVW